MTTESRELINKLSKRFNVASTFMLHLMEMDCNEDREQLEKQLIRVFDGAVARAKEEFIRQIRYEDLTKLQPYTYFTLIFENFDLVQAIREKEKNDESQIHHPFDL